ncbi:MAG TPA: amidase [Bryobacteraceae bacterium]|nr:amidase [Bryobacteraceae bacterium]
MQTTTPRTESLSEICGLSAVEMARRVRARELSARETLAAHLRQIERVNPRVNAIVTLVAERAMEQAREADEALARGNAAGPLHGLPIAHKDLQPTAGIRTTFGSRIYKDFIPTVDSLLVERIRGAGAILVGKTNTPEFGAGSQTFNEVFGATRNPYDLTKTCGGSSGGAAVALACHMLPLADGSDLASSVRNPASFCNVVGFRPSLGRLPAQPAAGWSSLSVDGPMARSVGDVAFFFAAMAGPDPRSTVSIDEPAGRFAAPYGRDFKGVRIAWWKDLGGLPVDPRVREITNAQRRVFESLGCIVEEAEPDFTGADEIFKVLRSWQVYQSLTALPQGDPRKQRELVKETVLWELDRGEKRTADEIARAESQRAELRRRISQFLERYEFFVLPVNQVLPFDVTQPYPTEIDGVPLTTYIDWMKSCFYISLVGHPAMSVPAGFTAEGLPVGIQIVGRWRDDWGVLQMGYAFEQAANVARARPAPWW